MNSYNFLPQRLNICKAISFTPKELIVKKSFVPSLLGVNTFENSKVKPSSKIITTIAVAENEPNDAVKITVYYPLEKTSVGFWAGDVFVSSKSQFQVVAFMLWLVNATVNGEMPKVGLL